MDKSWIKEPRYTRQYIEGVEEFLQFAFNNSADGVHIICPCTKCNMKRFQTRYGVRCHLLAKPFPQGYTVWTRHGEMAGNVGLVAAELVEVEDHTVTTNLNPMQQLVSDAFGMSLYRDSYGRDDHNEVGGMPLHNDDEAGPSVEGPSVEGPSVEPTDDFISLMKQGGEPLYDGSKFSRLQFLLRLYHIKYMHKISDTAMEKILELLLEAFDFAKLPKSSYEAKKHVKALGLNYEKIDACNNDCMLYTGANSDKTECIVCKRPRYLEASGVSETGKKAHKPRPEKVFRYFPLIPRLQRLYASTSSARNMVWHATPQTGDELIRHPRDAEAWKRVDSLFPDFADEPRNVRLGLATDGFNPFGVQSSSHSTWPVVVMPYNTPPWLCMKQTGLILNSIIPGPKQPGNDIDIYLQPLIDELNILWDGVETYDASTKETFKMRALLMSTISDFPGLCVLSGWNTYSDHACPVCNFDTIPRRLIAGGKFCFVGSRRFLPQGHSFRSKANRFDGTVDNRDPPIYPLGTEILEQLQNVKVLLGKHGLEPKKKSKKRSRDDDTSTVEVGSDIVKWKKKSIFFQLPYWRFNLLRHNLDVMHIEKNVCDNILLTLLNERGSKDNLKARQDLKAMKIRRELWPKKDGKTCPAALFTLGRQDITRVLETLKGISFPDGYASNISRCIDPGRRKMFGLKTHDLHTILHDLLPLAIREVLPISVSRVLTELCACFKQLCGTAHSVVELDKLQNRIVLALCHMEMIFPPSFITCQVHLVLHLVEEIKREGPVQYRWMYPIERYTLPYMLLHFFR
ncbi:hypothetical protein LINGRAHAP2_LOCUS13670 [Linum grandiflorum]